MNEGNSAHSLWAGSMLWYVSPNIPPVTEHEYMKEYPVATNVLETYTQIYPH